MVKGTISSLATVQNLDSQTPYEVVIGIGTYKFIITVTDKWGAFTVLTLNKTVEVIIKMLMLVQVVIMSPTGQLSAG